MPNDPSIRIGNSCLLRRVASIPARSVAWLRHSFAGGVSPLLSYRFILLVSFAEILVMAAASGFRGYETVDTGSYIGAFEWNILQMVPDTWRPPVYPVILGGLCHLFGEWAGRALTLLLQTFLFIISVGAFRSCCQMLWNRPKLTYLMTAVYALWPPAPSVACEMLSEGIAMPMTVILVWLMLRAVRRPSATLASVLGILTIFLIFLRPAFLFLLIFLPVGWLALMLMQKRSRQLKVATVCGLLWSVAGWGLVHCYSGEMKRNRGFYGITCVGDFNGLFTLREMNILTEYEGQNPEVRRLIDSLHAVGPSDVIAALPEIQRLQSFVRDDTLSAIVRLNMKEHPKELAAGMVNRAYRMSKTRLNYLSADNPVSRLIAPFSINFGCYNILMLAVAVMVIIRWKRRRQPPVMTITLWCFSASVTLVALLGAMNAWDRLVCPGQCAWMLLAGLLLNSLSLRRHASPLP